MNYKLSIIATFFNKEKSMQQYLGSLLAFDLEEVQMIWVNDGSKDNTLNLLNQFEDKIKRAKVVIVDQKNSGPGGARNAGFSFVEGEFVWFTDGDDVLHDNDILSEVNKLEDNVDFIDFNCLYKGKVINTMKIEEGNYSVGKNIIASDLFQCFGRLWTKIFRVSFWGDNSILYPENCIYEDNMLSFFVPLCVVNMRKIKNVGYEYAEDIGDSLTMNFNIRFYDRLFTAIAGYEKGKQLCRGNDKLLEINNSKFHEIFYINTVAIGKRDVFFLNYKKVYLSIWVHRWYSKKCLEYQIVPKYKLWLKFLSFIFPYNRLPEVFFKEIRSKAWGVNTSFNI